MAALVDESLKLLPQNQGQFSSKGYWDDFFVKYKEKTDESFEWYGVWKDFKTIVEKQHPEKLNTRVLVVGCGNSTLSEDLHDDGFPSVTSVDFSKVVIDEMTAKTAKKAGLEFLEMDMLNMSNEWSGRFDIVFDKGALDALMESEEVKQKNASGMFSEIDRVLKPGGVYVCVTLAQDHILQALNEYFTLDKHFDMKVFPFEPAAGSILIPFLFVLRKKASKPSRNVFLQPGNSNLNTPVTKYEQLIELIEDRRLVYHMHRNLRHGDNEKGVRGRFGLYSNAASTNHPRYLVSVVDSGLEPKQRRQSCGVLLVPQGRENEWTFSSAEGQVQIAEGNGFGRMIIVSMGRGHKFDSVQSVFDELSPSMLTLTPAYYSPSTEKMPYTTVGSDLGSRKVIDNVRSDLSGNMIVEDVSVTDPVTSSVHTHRRLVFLTNIDVIQSEGRLLTRRSTVGSKKKKGGKKKKNKTIVTQVVDTGYLAFEFHQAMVAGLYFLEDEADDDLYCVVGVGGGALVNYLAEKHEVHAVELDPAVVSVAEKHFAFNPEKNENISLHITDGRKFLNEETTHKYRVIVLDVDAKDLTKPVFFPPEEFLEESFLVNTRDNRLTKDGMVIMNLSCKSVTYQDEILVRIRKVFGLVLCIPMQSIGDSNCILFCLPGREGDRAPGELLKKALERARTAGAKPHDFHEMLTDTATVSADTGQLQDIEMK